MKIRSNVHTHTSFCDGSADPETVAAAAFAVCAVSLFTWDSSLTLHWPSIALFGVMLVAMNLPKLKKLPSVSFVGIAVPQLVKALFKTAKPLIVVPACFMGGAAFCLMCDLIARTLFAPTELSISSVTAVFGAPVVIAVMVRRRGGQT